MTRQRSKPRVPPLLCMYRSISVLYACPFVQQGLNDKLTPYACAVATHLHTLLTTLHAVPLPHLSLRLLWTCIYSTCPSLRFLPLLITLALYTHTCLLLHGGIHLCHKLPYKATSLTKRGAATTFTKPGRGTRWRRLPATVLAWRRISKANHAVAHRAVGPRCLWRASRRHRSPFNIALPAFVAAFHHCLDCAYAAAPTPHTAFLLPGTPFAARGGPGISRAAPYLDRKTPHLRGNVRVYRAPSARRAGATRVWRTGTHARWACPLTRTVLLQQRWNWAA